MPDICSGMLFVTNSASLCKHLLRFRHFGFNKVPQSLSQSPELSPILFSYGGPGPSAHECFEDVGFLPLGSFVLICNCDLLR